MGAIRSSLRPLLCEYRLKCWIGEVVELAIGVAFGSVRVSAGFRYPREAAICSQILTEEGCFVSRASSVRFYPLGGQNGFVFFAPVAEAPHCFIYNAPACNHVVVGGFHTPSASSDRDQSHHFRSSGALA